MASHARLDEGRWGGSSPHYGRGRPGDPLLVPGRSGRDLGCGWPLAFSFSFSFSHIFFSSYFSFLVCGSGGDWRTPGGEALLFFCLEPVVGRDSLFSFWARGPGGTLLFFQAPNLWGRLQSLASDVLPQSVLEGHERFERTRPTGGDARRN